MQKRTIKKGIISGTCWNTSYTICVLSLVKQEVWKRKGKIKRWWKEWMHPGNHYQPISKMDRNLDCELPSDFQMRLRRMSRCMYANGYRIGVLLCFFLFANVVMWVRIIGCLFNLVNTLCILWGVTLNQWYQYPTWN